MAAILSTPGRDQQPPQSAWTAVRPASRYDYRHDRAEARRRRVRRVRAIVVDAGPLIAAAIRTDPDKTAVSLMAYISRLAGEHDAAAYQCQPFSEEELALAAAGDWGPAEDWSDLAAWLDERHATR